MRIGIRVCATILVIVALLTTRGTIYMQINAAVEANKDAVNIVGMDALGRKIPEVSGFRSDRYVGLFYFIWFENSRADARDVTKLLRTNPNELWDPFDKTGIAPPLAMYYFNEPLYGYYSSKDPWVVKKHIELFISAGIDFLAIDVSNNEIYIDSLTVLLDTLEAFRQAGWDVPKVVFYTNLESGKTVKLLYNLFYKKGLYRDLWFYGPYDKPLIVAHKNELEEEIADFFYIRPAQWPGFEYEVYEDGFPFCDLNRPQRIHQNLINVSVAQHTAYVFSFGVKEDPRFTPRDINHGRGYTSENNTNGDVDAILRGANIQEQWDYAISQDPEIVFVTGWNEWATNKRAPESEEQTIAWFVDSFNTEFSRDIEMTKSPTYIVDEKTGKYIEEGYGDNYYMQLIQNIRRYKGIEGDLPMLVSMTIDINGDLSQWDSVNRIYKNISIDNMERSFGDYKQAAADNFLREIRVTHDKKNIYFLIKTDSDITLPVEGKTNWMNLFIGVDGSKEGSWESYNFVVNRNPFSLSKTSLEAFDNGYSLKHIGNVDYNVNGNIMQIAIPRTMLGIEKGDFKIYFKCADSIEEESDIMDYYVSGDSMPMGRLSYMYSSVSGKSAATGKLNLLSLIKWFLVIILVVLVAGIGWLLVGCSNKSGKVNGKMVESMVVPRVKSQRVNGELCSFGNEIKVYIDSDEAQVAISSLKAFLPEINFIEFNRKSSFIEFIHDSKISKHAEYYEIVISDKKILVKYVDRLAARNAASTIANLVEKSEELYALPQGSIIDYPDFSHRSALLESSGRAWMTLDELKQNITRMALSKFNYVHFHFMEYLGCSIELDNFQKLAGYGPKNSKYTKDEIRDLISFANSVGIEVVPGVEMPAHAQALLASYPELRCKTQPGVKTSSWVVCAGADETYDAFEKILTEVAELFPSKYIHIGADELDFGEGSGWEPAWMDCTRCKELRDREGISTEREIYYYVINRIHDVTTKLGKQIIMFNDQIDISVTPDIPKDIIIQFWRIATPGRGPVDGCTLERFLEEGFTVINSYFPETYVDFEEYASSESINQWTPLSSPEFDPKFSNQVIGGEFCAWEKHPHFKYTIPSAIVLYGDRLWNMETISYDDDYQTKMTRNLLGVNTPKDFNVFKYLGDVLPPRDDERKAYLEKVDADVNELEEAKNTLEKIVSADSYGADLASVYIECIDWVIKNK
jgi:hypothetical protein